MAVTMTQQFPATTDQYDEVNAKMDVENDPPNGLIVHTAARVGDDIRIVDVWESQGDYEKFLEDRLGPAVVEVMGPPPQDAPPPNLDFQELHNVIKP